MKVLWTVNMVFPEVANELGIHTSSSGGWLLDLAKSISKQHGIELATMTYYSGSTPVDINVDGIRHFLFPGGGKRLLFNSNKTIKDCKNVIEAFKPDIIHIHGTEYAHSLAVIKADSKIPKLLTIQGIINRIADEYYGGLTFKEKLKSIKLIELLKMKSTFHKKILFRYNSIREKKILNNIEFVTGRTDWDKSVMLSINSNLKYFRHNYNLREPFYNEQKWDVKNIERHSIITGAGGYPLKGLHILLKAVALVKKDYPDIILYVPGGNAVNGKLQDTSGYQKFILSLIKELNITNNVRFLGSLTAVEVKEYLLKSNVCVVPSAIEGASATLCEAMMVGTPVIASYRGGMTDLVTDNISGYTYDFIEHPVLAYKIRQIFNNDDVSSLFSDRSISNAIHRHNRDFNSNHLTTIYKQLLK